MVNFFPVSPCTCVTKTALCRQKQPIKQKYTTGWHQTRTMNKTQQTEEMDKVPRITQEMTYQADLDILYQPKHKENGCHEPNDNKQNLQREREHNSNNNKKTQMA